MHYSDVDTRHRIVQSAHISTTECTNWLHTVNRLPKVVRLIGSTNCEVYGNTPQKPVFSAVYTPSCTNAQCNKQKPNVHTGVINNNETIVNKHNQETIVKKHKSNSMSIEYFTDESISYTFNCKRSNFLVYNISYTQLSGLIIQGQKMDILLK